MKVCLIGANRGCKTKLVRGHVIDQLDDCYITTVGAKVTKKELKLEAPSAGTPVTVDLMLWDLKSAPRLRELLNEAYVHGSRGILAVTDMTRRHTLDDLRDWIEGIKGVTGPVPVAVIGANRDCTEKLEVSEDEVADVAKKHDAPCFFESSGSGEPVEAAFRYLAEAILRSISKGRADRPRREGNGSRSTAPSASGGGPR